MSLTREPAFARFGATPGCAPSETTQARTKRSTGVLSPQRDNMNESPCEEFSCKNFIPCGVDLLCCDSFIYYVRTGRASHPMMVIPLRQSNGHRPYMAEEIVATREKYNVMVTLDE
jgi:hypothetical protein